MVIPNSSANNLYISWKNILYLFLLNGFLILKSIITNNKDMIQLDSTRGMRHLVENNNIVYGVQPYPNWRDKNRSRCLGMLNLSPTSRDLYSPIDS